MKPSYGKEFNLRYMNSVKKAKEKQNNSFKDAFKMPHEGLPFFNYFDY